MIKFILLCVMFFTIVLNAQPTVSEVVSAVKSNPALLDTPQAKAEMQKRGVNKDDVLKKVQAKDEKTSIEVEVVDNDIEDTEVISKEEVKKENIKVKNGAYVNPLAYKSSNYILNQLAKKQSNFSYRNLPRFGVEFFKNKNNFKSSDIAVPSYYILSKGDVISIWIYGTKNAHLTLKINNRGDIELPKLGPLNIAGKEFSEFEKIITAKLEQNYPNSHVVVDIDAYSTIQVNLIGEVNAPGVYNISSLSTISNLLIEAKGIKSTASLRNIFIKRDGKTLAVIDFYKLLKNADKTFSLLLKSNDTVFIPKADKIVSIDGEVNNPAKYELKKDETLFDLLNLAGNIKSTGSKYGFIVKRYIDNSKSKILEVDLNDAKYFKLYNDDKIYVKKIDKVHKESIYIYGNVVRPGERELSKDKSLKTLLTKEIDKLTLKGVFLDNTLFDYALVKRKTDTLDKEIININLAKIIAKFSDFKLKNNDEIFVFNKYNSNIAPFVTIKGSVVGKAGKYAYYENMKVQDIINIAGAKAYSKIKLTTYNTEDLMPHISFVDTDYLLSPFDEVELIDYYLDHHIKYFTISGEVNQPNEYTLNNNMTLLEAIKVAGDFTRKAFKVNFEVIRYDIVNNERERKILRVLDKDISTFKLKEDDEIIVRRIPKWYDKKSIELKGEVKFPGTYTIKTGERLSSVIKRAGGFTNEAFIDGALFTRESIKKNEEKQMQNALLKLKQDISFSGLNAKEAGAEKKSTSELMSSVSMIEKQTKNYKAVGRLVIYLDKDLDKFTNSDYDVRLEDKDTLTIPNYNDTVSIYGEVMNPKSFVYIKDNDFSFYVEKAGGLTSKADEDSIYVILANGESKALKTSYLFSSSDDYIPAGSTIYIPMKIDPVSDILLWKDISQIVYQLAITAASLSTVGAL